MIRELYILTVIGCLAVQALNLLGAFPKTVDAVSIPLYLTSVALMVIAGIVALWQMLVVNAKRVEAANIDASAVPERVFDYRRQKPLSAFMFAIAGMLAAPMFLVWPLLWVLNPQVAAHPAIPIVGAFLLLVALVPFVVARRYWNAHATIYPDRLEVRGIYSNGSMKWNEATAFLHEETLIGDGSMWAYYLCSETRGIRVEASIREPEEFIGRVQAKTGLTLQERPIGWTPESTPPVQQHHEAFQK